MELVGRERMARSAGRGSTKAPSNATASITLAALSDLVRDGKVRYIGSSSYSGSKSVEAQWGLYDRNLARFVTEQPPYSILVRGVEEDVLPGCSGTGWHDGAVADLSARRRPVPAGDVLDRIDDVVAPGVTVNPDDNSYVRRSCCPLRGGAENENHDPFGPHRLVWVGYPTMPSTRPAGLSVGDPLDCR